MTSRVLQGLLAYRTTRGRVFYREIILGRFVPLADLPRSLLLSVPHALLSLAPSPLTHCCPPPSPPPPRLAVAAFLARLFLALRQLLISGNYFDLRQLL